VWGSRDLREDHPFGSTNSDFLLYALWDILQ
jgi:hypothetical protein